jgi:transposase-like protein
MARNSFLAGSRVSFSRFLIFGINFMETNLVQLIEQFNSEDTCRAYLQELRWPKGITCPRCNCQSVSHIAERNQYDCNACRYQFSVTTGSVFHDTHLPLWKWFLAVYLMCEAKKSVSANQMKRTLGVAYKTAWHLCHRIRHAMQPDNTALNGVIEADETYVGGSQPGKRGRGAAGKTAVAGMVERGGQVRFETMSKLDKESLTKFIEANLGKNVKMVITDALPAYNAIGRTVKHKKINKSKEITTGDAHINSIENVWSLLKRGLIGSYHKVSTKHLPAYLNEVGFRFNNRDNPMLFKETMTRLLNHKQITFEQLAA